ncbi:MFS transporter [Paeniglutamicibacter antarcticus]|uniref:MFS transporter n=1 Tax=Paeniglutamicibacter antarcticus TaxID=494023 RepID=A0ABP9TQB1_9MICC
MKFGRYGQLLKQRGVAPLLLIGMVARLPHSAVGMLLLLHLVNDLGQDWGSAGLVVALMTIGIALGAPWRGHIVDIYGLRRALIPSVIAEAVVWSIVPQVSFTWILPLVFLGGLFSVPVFSVVRTSLGVMTTGDNRRSAFALDAMATELVFIVGPASAGIVATSLDTTIGMIGIAAAASLSGLALMILNPPTRSDQPGAVAQKPNPHEERLGAEASLIAASPGGLASVEGELILAGAKSTRARIAAHGEDFRDKFGWISASVIAVFIASSGAGLVLSGTEVGILSLLEEHQSEGQLGIVFLFWCGASLLGGLVYGSLSRRVSPIVLLLAMAVLTIPMAFATDTWSLALLSIPSGMLCAPVLSAASEWLTDLVAEKRRGEAMGWYGSALTGGTALGSPITGATVDGFGANAGFITVGVIGAVICAVALGAQQLRRRRARGRARSRVRTLLAED